MSHPLQLIPSLHEFLLRNCLQQISPVYKEDRRRLLRWAEGEPSFIADPLIEFDEPFAPGPLSWQQMVAADLLHQKTYELLLRSQTIKGDFPYLHQHEAIVQAAAGRSILVSAGTGSGKTECFLIPILDSLVREALQSGPLIGLRSLLVYPLNALVNDQAARWRSILRHQKEVLGKVFIRMALYTGELSSQALGTDLKNAIAGDTQLEKDGEPFQPLEEGEVRTRRELQGGGKKGAQIVITNYVMLALAQMRVQDRIWLKEAQGWRHLVLDEAHTYQGGLALDIALLMRRLRFVIQPFQVPQGFATSATFGAQQTADLKSFTKDLFGCQEAEVIFGQRREIKAEHMPADVSDDLRLLLRLLAEKRDPKGIKTTTLTLSELASALFPPVENPAGAPATHSQQAALARTLTLLEEAGSRKLPASSRCLIPHRVYLQSRMPAAQGSYCINPHCPGGKATGDPDWPPLGGEGVSSGDAHCPDCPSPMLQKVHCPKCQLEGLLARREVSQFPPRTTLHWAPFDPHRENKGDVLLVPTSLGSQGSPCQILPSGELKASASASPWQYFILDKKICPQCPGSELAQRRTDYDVKREVTVNFLIDHLQPSGGSGLAMSFSDSRQGAARLAPKVRQDNTQHLTALGLVQALRAQEAGHAQAATEKLKLASDLNLLRQLSPSAENLAHLRRSEEKLALLEKNAISIERLLHLFFAQEETARLWALSLGHARFASIFKGETEEQERLSRERDWYTNWANGEMDAALAQLKEMGPDKPTLSKWLLEQAIVEFSLTLCSEKTDYSLQRLGLLRMQFDDLLRGFSFPGLPDPLAQESLAVALLRAFYQGGFLLQLEREGDFAGPSFHHGKRIALHQNASSQTISLRPSNLMTTRLGAYLRLLLEDKGLGSPEALFEAFKEHLERLQPTPKYLQRNSRDGLPELGLLFRHMALHAGDSSFRCVRCGSFTPFSLLGRCSAPLWPGKKNDRTAKPCGGTLEETDLWREMKSLEQDAHPQSRQLLFALQGPKTARRPFEHTAQRSKNPTLRRDELRFRRGDLDLLCSSTTLELGVDLPNLDSVLLMNVPYHAANTAQRVGRAGRSRERPALAYTFTGNDAFESWVFRDLKAFFARPTLTPVVEFNRQQTVRMHFRAWRLGLWVRQQNLFTARSYKEHGNLLDKIAPFAGLNCSADDARRHREAWEKKAGARWREEADPGWGHLLQLEWLEVEEQLMPLLADLFQQERASLKKWLAEDSRKLAEHLQELRSGFIHLSKAFYMLDEKDRKADRMQVALKQYCGQDTLEWLTSQRFLPKFAFPVGILELSGPLNEKELLQRDLPNALREWQPGCSIVVDNHLWKVKGLKANPKRGKLETFTTRYRQIYCPHCKTTQALPQEANTCISCNQILQDLPFCEIIQPSAMLREQFTPLYVGQTLIPGAPPEFLPCKTLPAALTPQFVAETSLMIVIPQRLEERSLCCPKCGHVEKDGRTTRERICEECGGNAVLGWLGGEYPCDLLIWHPPESPDLESQSYAATRTLAQGLRLAACWQLQLDPRMLHVLKVDATHNTRMIWADLVGGGTGLLSTLTRAHEQRQWLSSCRALLDHQGKPTRCTSACPECLITRDNAAEHEQEPYQRKLALRYLDFLLAQS